MLGIWKERRRNEMSLVPRISPGDLCSLFPDATLTSWQRFSPPLGLGLDLGPCLAGSA